MTVEPGGLRDLEQIQRWMHAVITHPDGVNAGIESDAARVEINIPAEQIEQVVDRSKLRTSTQRLEVYANAYYARLLECLRDEFPALAHAVGDEVFDGLAFGYLQSYPSTSYTLSNLGRSFPKFLEETRPQEETQSDGPSWPEFMIDLARLERTYSEVFDGPGPERSELLKADRIAAIPPESWPETRLVPVPCLRLLSARFPVHEYATSVRRKENPTIPDAEPTWLAVSRIDYVVRRWPLSPLQYQLLKSLVGGRTVGEALEALASTAHSDDQFDHLATNLRDWFEEWSASGFFTEILLPEHPGAAAD